MNTLSGNSNMVDTSGRVVEPAGEGDQFPALDPAAVDDLPEDGGLEASAAQDQPRWLLKKLKPKHRDICSLFAQGMKRSDIARLCDVTPEYVTMLMRQPLIVEEVKRMNEYAGLQMEAAFTKAVSVTLEAMEVGSTKEKLAAARLQMEVTGRVGSRGAPPQENQNMNERLVALSERLTGLLGHAREAIPGTSRRIEEGA